MKDIEYITYNIESTFIQPAFTFWYITVHIIKDIPPISGKIPNPFTDKAINSP